MELASNALKMLASWKWRRKIGADMTVSKFKDAA